jgi:ligand-binding sensor protein
MQLTDILPIDDWLSFQEEVDRTFGTGPSIYDAEGRQATRYECEGNPVCQAIRGVPDGGTQICARSHQTIMAMAQRQRGTVIEECDAAMVKVIVPIFADDEFVGAAGVCGLLWHDEEVDAFYVSKVTGIPEADIEDLAQTTKRLTRTEAETIAEFMAARIKAATTG